MEIAVTGPEFGDFHFESACSTPYISAPSTPKRFGEYFRSAPTSPAHASDFNGSRTIDGRGFKSKTTEDDEVTFYEDDFAFDFRGQMERTSLSAEELFDGGVIRPLKPSTGLQLGDQSYSSVSSPKSPRSPISQGKKMIRDVFSPKQKKNSDSFAAGIQETQKVSDQSQNRGREKVTVPMSSRSGRRGSRSLSPCRVPELELEEPKQQQQQQQENVKSASSISKQSSSSSSSSSSSGSRKWRLRDLLLFRSASEGRASEKDPLRKYTILPKKHQESIESIGSPASSPRRKGPVSPHELHYVTNRAASEDMKKKTFLPYKQRLLSVSKGFGYFTRG